jgi:transcriptional regulator with XRE-family HTH domain
MERTLREVLGERLHLARRRAGISQVALAKRAGISPTTLNRVELGRQKLYVETLVTLARILGVSIDALVAMEEDQPLSAETHASEATPRTPPTPTRQRTRKTGPVR